MVSLLELCISRMELYSYVLFTSVRFAEMSTPSKRTVQEPSSVQFETCGREKWRKCTHNMFGCHYDKIKLQERSTGNFVASVYTVTVD